MERKYKDKLALEDTIAFLLEDNGFRKEKRPDWQYPDERLLRRAEELLADQQRQSTSAETGRQGMKSSGPGAPATWPGNKDFDPAKLYAKPELAKNHWRYNQRTGQLLDPNGKLHRERGYSGTPRYKNRPEMQDVSFQGPIPRGRYEIGHDTGSKGPLSLMLTPNGHNALGRDNLLIHGDSKDNPGKASQGCIVLTRQQREQIYRSKYRFLEVVDEPEWF